MRSKTSGFFLAAPAVFLLALANAPANAADPETVVLKAAHLFDGQSGKLQSPGVLVVRGKNIVGTGSGAEIPAGSRVIDLGNATLLPGYIDAHTHLTFDNNENWAQGFYEGMLRFPVEQSFHAAHNAKVTLQAGVTTVREVGASDFIDIALRNAINDGLVEGPRMLVAGNSLGSTGGHCDASPFPPDRIALSGPLQGVCNGADECRQAVRLQMKYGADLIKICASGGVLSESDPVDVPQLTPEELAAIVGEAHTWGRKVAAHSHGDLAAKQAVDAGVDSIEHGSFLETDTLQAMKANGVYLVPTRMTLVWVLDKLDGYPPKIAAKGKAAGDSHDAMFRNAMKIGVPIAFGTDAAVYPHGMNAREFGDYVALGMTPADALMTSSQGAAKLLGVENETGTLTAGKFADIVAVPGNVLEDIRATERPIMVMKQGAIVREAE
ncbi:amidohydrolase family protein [Dokdonella sp.]|uniref:metal-dependent hydrolase family protein n=1 Tax=Dokdonella sp. TaxID=2291710 RepID=UPI003C4B3825